jgi:hypothetical protein
MPKLNGISRDDDMRPGTLWLLMARYQGAPMIPLSQIVKDFFWHLDEKKLLQKVLRGEIKLTIVRMERSQKSARGVMLVDLVDYLDRQRAMALKELDQLTRGISTTFRTT